MVYTLSGSGSQALSSPGSLAVVLTVPPTDVELGTAYPRNIYHAGLLRLGTAHGYLPPIPVDADAQLVPCPNGCTTLGYSLRPGVTITVEERAEQPYAGPTGPPGATGATGATGAAGAAGSTLIESYHPASATDTSHTFTIPSGYGHLRWLASVRSDAAGVSNEAWALRCNGDTANNYDWDGLISSGGAPSGTNALVTGSMQLGLVPAATAASGAATTAEGFIADYRGTAFYKRMQNVANWWTTSAPQGRYYNGIWKSTAAITSLTFLLQSGHFAVGTRIDVYGVV